LPQGLPKKIELQLLPADLALQLANKLARRPNIPQRRRLSRASHSSRPPSAPQHPFPVELQPPLVQMELRYTKLGSKSLNRLPRNQPLNRGKLELRLKYPTLSFGHQFSPSRTVPYFSVSL
jgi:hypothetical protein